MKSIVLVDRFASSLSTGSPLTAYSGVTETHGDRRRSEALTENPFSDRMIVVA